ncbi:MAG: DUF3160 domain-containing protein [Actinomycetia bacterium]|nr:DUF3160 domain-containing protein [Actinomycetes bacterium]
MIGCGATFSHYEFTVLIAKQVTDEAWHKRLAKNDLPSYED